MASLVRFLQGQSFDRGGPISVARARVDGMPFRGTAPLVREDEYDAVTEVVRDGHVRVFDLSQPEDLRTLNEVVDQAANHWWTILKMSEHFATQPDGSVKVTVYCVWTESYRESIARTPSP